MAEQDDLRAVAGKALADPEFRQKLLDNPEAAVKEAGFQLSPDQLAALNNMDKAELEKGLVDLDQRLTMACWGKAQSICGWD
jgi:Ribosomally synthesized peptide prototyped by Frankia Franean1_4349.